MHRGRQIYEDVNLLFSSKFMDFLMTDLFFGKTVGNRKSMSHEPYLNLFYIFSASSSTFFNQSEAQIVYLSTTPRHCWKSIIHIWQMAATCRRFANLMVLFKKKLLTPSTASICSSPFCKTKVCFALPKLWGSMFPFPIGRFISQSPNLCQARLCRSCCGDLSSEAVEEVLPQLAYTCHELLALASIHGGSYKQTL